MFQLRFMPQYLLFCIAVTLSCPVFAQGTDAEPNNPCPVAQDVTAAQWPYTISGNLDSGVGGSADIDFYRLTGDPGVHLRADLMGAAFGSGTLQDPLLGLFDTDCNLLNLNDDFNSADSRLIFRVPDNSTYILAATAFPDFSFTGGGEGSYELVISELEFADSIGGRLVNARDGTPLSGDYPTGAYAQLFRCNNDVCFEYVNFVSADLNGQVHFETDYIGNPLLAGRYQIQASAQGFEFLTTEPFDVANNQVLDLGDIALTPLRIIGSVSGRLVDALDGRPLSGFGPPNAVAILERCDEHGCFGVGVAYANEQGFFQVLGASNLIPPDTFRVTVMADDYQQTITETFFVDEFEHVDLGDVAITPVAIQFGAITPCELPPGGGLCEFSIEVRNASSEKFKGFAWSIVDFFPNAPPHRQSSFQVGKAGASNPSPQRLKLRAGEIGTLRFQLEVPSGLLPDGSSLCAVANVGSGDYAQFQSSGDRFLFCMALYSGEFKTLPEKQGRKLFRELTRSTVKK